MINLFLDELAGTFGDVSLGLVVWQVSDLQRLRVRNRKAFYRATAR
jgi:hypothetical protein